MTNLKINQGSNPEKLMRVCAKDAQDKALYDTHVVYRGRPIQ